MRVSVHNNYNHLGAHVPLVHSNLNVNKFRQLLPEQFEDLAILQYMEYGFPLGLVEDFNLKPVLKNHSSIYDYHLHVDKFIKTERDKWGMTG